ncbi:stalk domain-containing protein [Paenibacillus periandrae]|uniref:stalk domain-containing protein n=1 Tax=Paenibacillus periandrae TaxID=1761741 RepID=UPI001F099CAE|nr:stalk domain-containing protein [Paenibacillus periandrae]
MQKRLLAGVIGTTLLLGLGTGALAASSLEEIKAYLNGEIKFKVNGADWRPSDEKGNEMMPITYNGNTYVPLRSVSTALNTPIDYNGETKTVILGEKVDGVTLFSKTIKLLNPADSDVADLIDKEQLVINGKQYDGAFRLRTMYQFIRVMRVDLGKPYTKMHLVVGAKGSDVNVKIFNKDDVVLKEFALKKDEVKELDIDLNNSQNLKINSAGTEKGQEGNVYFLKDSIVK